MEHSQGRQHEPELDFKEWSMKARIRRENNRGSSRRYSASFIGTLLREDEEPASKSFRSHAYTISSTASSPGYTLKGDIDPSTYSFTTALKALKSKNIYSWEQMSPEGRLPLNSKWSEAERYICNPLSGEFPLECLSAKTLSARSFHQHSARIAISTPNVPLPPRHLQRKPSTAIHEDELKFPIHEDKIDSIKRDGGMESPTPVNMDSSNPSPVTPSIEERAIKRSGAESEDSLQSSENRMFDMKEEMKEANEEEQGGREANEGKNDQNGSKKMMSRSRQGAGGCFVLWRTLWKKGNNERNHAKITKKKNIFLCQKIGCLKE